MNSYFADLHIHIGRTEADTPVKISAARSLTFYNIAKEASERKGIEMIGIIDCHAPKVQSDIMEYLHRGEMAEQAGGGIRYHDTTVILGCELEVKDEGFGAAHLLAYLPDLASMQDFTAWLRKVMKNVELSSQRIYAPARVLQEEVYSRGGIVVPAHIFFTPYKGAYGNASARMEHFLDLRRIAAVELGLSADTEMAGVISELDPFTYVTNSDAHSLSKIGREYNRLAMEAATFEELAKALNRQDGRAVRANYGLNPRLGKYHRTYCSQCDSILSEREWGLTTLSATLQRVPGEAAERCPYCGSKSIVRGVLDRIMDVADREAPVLHGSRPPYHFQVPLEFIPGLGPKMLTRLLERFGTEMDIIHHASEDELAEEAGSEIARYIVLARENALELTSGGGGTYGKVSKLLS